MNCHWNSIYTEFFPSEMPAEYPEAALRAQAVCARSYAEKQKQNNRLKEYDAQVDDSVAYQVYQSQPGG